MFDIALFRGANPKTEPHLLQSGEAQRAVNARLQTGGLMPFRGPTTVQATTVPGVTSIHRFGDTAFWFEFAGDVDVAEGPRRSDTETTTYFTGDGAPAMTYVGLATGGGGPYPSNRYRLGVPAPAASVIATVNGTADPNDTEADSRVYAVTYVSARGEEGPPSPASNLVDVYDGQSVVLSNLPSAPTGNYNITLKRIYRTSSAAGDTEYLYVAELPVGQASYTDTTAADQLGEVLPSYDWNPPPDTMAGLIALENGVMAGFDGKELYLCEPYMPHAWPYSLTMDRPIVGLVGIRGGVVVATQGQPVIVSFTHPGSASQSPIENPRACVSKRSMVDMGDYALYATADGLVAVDGAGNAPVISAAVLDRYQWQRFNPSTMHAYRLDGWYIGFYQGQDGNGGFAISAQGDAYVALDFYADAGYTDPNDGGLYLVIDGNLVKWDDDAANPLSYLWQSGVTLTSQPANPAAARVDADDYPSPGDASLVFKVYADDALIHTQLVTSSAPFRLPAGYLARRFSVELSGTRTVRRVTVSESMDLLT
ncbi:hypothetical protein [Marinobacter sp.]|uniref:hypothetical protein n=1 Tax=Marinobacter sp. TaxID=50741 RepID=UPI003A8FA38C